MDVYDILIRFVEEIAKLNVPVVFKGAVVLKEAMRGIPVGTDRGTRDVDLNWVSGRPSMEYLTSVIETAVSNLGFGYTVKVHRTYDVNRSAGYNVYDRSGERQFKLDVSVEECAPYCVYATLNGVRFYGATPQKMMSDKVRCVSSNAVLRRAKDVYDLYLLSALTGYNLQDIWSLCGAVGDFNRFLHSKSDLAHAYAVRQGINNRPDFEVLYSRVSHFIMPFIRGIHANLVWNGYDWVKGSVG